MKFSLAMAIIVGVILLCILLYSLFYFCMYGTWCCPGLGCFWCPQQPVAAPPCDDDEPVKVRIRRPSGADSCRSSMRSERSVCSHQSYADPQPLIIQTVPAVQPAPTIIQQAPSIIQAAPQVYQPPPQVYQPPPQVYQPPPQIIQAPPQIIQSAPVYQVAPPAPAPVYNSGPSELRVVIGSGARNDSAPSNSGRGNVIVYDMGTSNGGFSADF